MFQRPLPPCVGVVTEPSYCLILSLLLRARPRPTAEGLAWALNEGPSGLVLDWATEAQAHLQVWVWRKLCAWETTRHAVSHGGSPRLLEAWNMSSHRLLMSRYRCCWLQAQCCSSIWWRWIGNSRRIRCYGWCSQHRSNGSSPCIFSTCKLSPLLLFVCNATLLAPNWYHLD